MQQPNSITLLRPLIAALLATSLLACYDPSLADENFVCAPTGKPCPDDFVCNKKTKRCVKAESLPVDAGVETTPTDMTAVPTKEGPVVIDGAVVKPSNNCIDEASEPNNSANAEKTPKLPAKSSTLQDWEICYPGDVDHYAFELAADQKFSITIKFDHDKGVPDSNEGDLEAALVNPKGFVIQSSRSETDNEQLLVSNVTTPGTYYVAVYGFADATNQYDLIIEVE